MKKALLTQRDIEILRCLWRWKLVSTAALTAKFFASCSGSTAYIRLWMLKKAGYIAFQTNGEGQLFLWSLTQKGFQAIREYLPHLAEDGFKSENLVHDRWVTAIHLGEFLNCAPEGSEFFTEQELRRFENEDYPGWVPASKIHRPDGYWRVPRGNKFLAVALEVELHRKRESFYKNVGSFYENAKCVDRVLWVLPNSSMIQTIGDKLEQFLGPRATIHDFVKLPEIVERGWEAAILRGAEQGRTINFLLNPNQTSPKPVWTPLLLDSRKCPHKSKTYDFVPRSESRN